MALSLGEAVVSITGDVSGLSKAMDAAENKLQTVGKSMTKIGVGMSAAITAPLVGIAVAASKAAIDLDKSMKSIQSITKQTNDEIQGLSDTFLDMSQDMSITTASADDLAQGYYDIAQSSAAWAREGREAADMMQVLEVSTKAATAGLVDTATATDVMTSVLSAYRLTAEDAREVSDILFKTVDVGKVSFQELASGLGNVMGSASMTGVSLTEVGAAIATITNTGIGAEEAITSLNRVMMAFIKPTEDMKALLQELGYESGQAMLQELGLAGSIELVTSTTHGSAEATAALFGDIRGLKGVLALASGDMVPYKNNLLEMQQATEGAGATQAAFSIQTQSVAAHMKNLHNNVNVAAIALGTALLPTIVSLSETIVPLVQRFADWVIALNETNPGLVKVGLAVAGVAAALGPVLIILGQMLPVLGAVASVAGAAAGAAGFGALLAVLGPVGLALGALIIFEQKHLEVAKKLGPAALEMAKDVDYFNDVVLAGLDAHEAYGKQMTTSAEAMHTLRKAAEAAASEEMRMAESADRVAESTSGMTGMASEAAGAIDGFTSSMGGLSEAIELSEDDIAALAKSFDEVSTAVAEGMVEMDNARKTYEAESKKAAEQYEKDLLEAHKTGNIELENETKEHYIKEKAERDRAHQEELADLAQQFAEKLYAQTYELERAGQITKQEGINMRGALVEAYGNIINDTELYKTDFEKVMASWRDGTGSTIDDVIDIMVNYQIQHAKSVDAVKTKQAEEALAYKLSKNDILTSIKEVQGGIVGYDDTVQTVFPAATTTVSTSSAGMVTSLGNFGRGLDEGKTKVGEFGAAINNLPTHKEITVRATLVYGDDASRDAFMQQSPHFAIEYALENFAHTAEHLNPINIEVNLTGNGAKSLTGGATPVRPPEILFAGYHNTKAELDALVAAEEDRYAKRIAELLTLRQEGRISAEELFNSLQEEIDHHGEIMAGFQERYAFLAQVYSSVIAWERDYGEAIEDTTEVLTAQQQAQNDAIDAHSALVESMENKESSRHNQMVNDLEAEQAQLEEWRDTMLEGIDAARDAEEERHNLAAGNIADSIDRLDDYYGFTMQAEPSLKDLEDERHDTVMAQIAEHKAAILDVYDRQKERIEGLKEAENGRHTAIMSDLDKEKGAWDDAHAAFVDALEDELDAREAAHDRLLDQLDEEAEAEKERNDAAIKGLQAEKTAIEEKIDAINKAAEARDREMDRANLAQTMAEGYQGEWATTQVTVSQERLNQLVANQIISQAKANEIIANGSQVTKGWLDEWTWKLENIYELQGLNEQDEIDALQAQADAVQARIDAENEHSAEVLAAIQTRRDAEQEAFDLWKVNFDARKEAEQEAYDLWKEGWDQRVEDENAQHKKALEDLEKTLKLYEDIKDRRLTVLADEMAAETALHEQKLAALQAEYDAQRAALEQLRLDEEARHTQILADLDAEEDRIEAIFTATANLLTAAAAVVAAGGGYWGTELIQGIIEGINERMPDLEAVLDYIAGMMGIVAGETAGGGEVGLEAPGAPTAGLPGGTPGQWPSIAPANPPVEHYQLGGLIKRTGLALVHSGEAVLPANAFHSFMDMLTRWTGGGMVPAYAEAGGGVTVNMTGPVSLRSEQDIQRLADEIDRRIGQARNIRRRLGE